MINYLIKHFFFCAVVIFSSMLDSCFSNYADAPEIMGDWVSGPSGSQNVPRQNNFRYHFGKTKGKAIHIKAPNSGKLAYFEIHPLTSKADFFDQNSQNYYSCSTGLLVNFFKKTGESEYEEYPFYGDYDAIDKKITLKNRKMRATFEAMVRM